MTTAIQDTIKWFEAAKPEPIKEDLCVQLGCDIKKQAEQLELFDEHIEFDSCQLQSVACGFKQLGFDELEGVVNLLEQYEFVAQLIDAQADKIVTSIGILVFLKKMGYTNADFEIIEEVVKSHWSKFEDGKPVFDENGKIKKGKNYKKPDLEKFIN